MEGEWVNLCPWHLPSFYIFCSHTSEYHVTHSVFIFVLSADKVYIKGRDIHVLFRILNNWNPWISFYCCYSTSHCWDKLCSSNIIFWDNQFMYLLSFHLKTGLPWLMVTWADERTVACYFFLYYFPLYCLEFIFVFPLRNKSVPLIWRETLYFLISYFIQALFGCHK